MDQVWNRRTLLPSVTRRTFFLSIECVILWQSSALPKDWWLDSGWCQEEICWPVEILQREQRRRLNPDTMFQIRTEEWLKQRQTEDERWKQIIAPVLVGFNDCTTILPDIVLHEILPFLRASNYVSALTLRSSFSYVSHCFADPYHTLHYSITRIATWHHYRSYIHASTMGSCSSSPHIQVACDNVLKSCQQRKPADPTELVHVLANLSPRVLKRVEVKDLEGDENRFLALVRRRFSENPTCTAHQIVYEVCQGLLEWQIGISYPELYPSPPSPLLPSLPSDRKNFPKWIRQLRDQLPDRLASYFSATVSTEPNMVAVLRVLQSDHPEQLNLHQPKFMWRILSSTTDRLKELEPVSLILLRRIEAAEVSTPGILSSVLGFTRADPVSSDSTDLISSLYRLVLGCQLVPSPWRFVDDTTSCFLFNFFYSYGPRSEVPTQIIRMIQFILQTDRAMPPADHEVGSNGARWSNTVLRELDPNHLWNRPTLLPAVTYRSFIMAVESTAIDSDHYPVRVRDYREWWISTSWCQEEVCWPLEILKHGRANRDSTFKPCDEEWIFATETEHWQHIIAPIIDAFNDCTSILPDLVQSEILPFLRASSQRRDADVSNQA